jgi:hypothetical protein
MWTNDRITFTLPTYYAGYLINSDPAGLTQQEFDDIERFVQEIAQEQNVHIVSMDDDNHFAGSNDLNNVGGDCSTFVAISL